MCGENARHLKKRCLNCEGPHSVLATRCPKRKELINKKRKAEQEKESTGYYCPEKKKKLR